MNAVCRKRNNGEKNDVPKDGSKNNSFVSGVVILTFSNLLVKITGLLFKIPMSRIIGDMGMGYFNSAYSVYTFFYMLSTSGLPVAIAVMISEKRASGSIRAAKAVFRAALVLFAVGGCAVSLLMLFTAEEMAGLIRSDKAALSIIAAAPTMLFICVSSAFRGYFQGCGNMLPTAISQLIEAIGKLACGITLAAYAVGAGKNIETVSAFAICGLTVGSFAGMLYLIAVKLWRGDRDLLREDLSICHESVPYRTILRRFLKISLPITISASVMSLTNMIDTALIQRILRHSGLSAESAAAQFGNYTSLAVPMFNLPPTLVYPIAYSTVPEVVSALFSGEEEKAAKAMENSLRASVIIGLPCAVGLCVLSKPILNLFYRADSASLAAPLLTLLAPSSLFVCILAVTNSILHSCGEEKKTVVSMLCGAVVKCAASLYFLPRYGIAGAPMSTFLCYLAVTVLNLAFVVKKTGICPKFSKIFVIPAIAGFACAGTAAAFNGLFAGQIGKIACPVSILIGAGVYFAILLASGNVTKEEIFEIIGRKKR